MTTQVANIHCIFTMNGLPNQLIEYLSFTDMIHIESCSTEIKRAFEGALININSQRAIDLSSKKILQINMPFETPYSELKKKIKQLIEPEKAENSGRVLRCLIKRFGFQIPPSKKLPNNADEKAYTDECLKHPGALSEYIISNKKISQKKSFRFQSEIFN